MAIGQPIFHKKLVEDDNIILEKAVSNMYFANRDIKELEEFWLAYLMMTTNRKDYILEDIEELRIDFTDTTEGRFEHEL